MNTTSYKQNGWARHVFVKWSGHV